MQMIRSRDHQRVAQPRLQQGGMTSEFGALLARHVRGTRAHSLVRIAYGRDTCTLQETDRADMFLPHHA